MASTRNANKVLNRVAWRLRWASYGKRFYSSLIILGLLFLLALIANRLTGYSVDGFPLDVRNLLSVPALAAVVAAIWHRRPTRKDAARVVDQVNHTQDLFLTYALLEQSSGEYKPLVHQAANDRADTVEPSTVVPWRWTPAFVRSVLLGAVLVLCVLYVPQLDPFGVAQAAEAEKTMLENLAKDRTATEVRTAALKELGDKSEESEQVNQAIEEMTRSFQKMRQNEPRPNLERLNMHQADIGQKWRKLGAEKLRSLLGQNQTFQDFGGQRQQKLQEWSKELLEGSSAGLKEELSELQAQLDKMLSESDPVQRSRMMRELKEQLRDLSEFASENVGSPELAAALRRAMRQLEAIEKGEGEMKEAFEALVDSLDLSKLEL